MPSARRLRIVMLGLTVTSSWGNGHATTYRGLISGLTRRGHYVSFLERDMPWYAEHRDLPALPDGDVVLYGSVDALASRHGDLIRHADIVIVGSYVADGIAVGTLVQRLATGMTAFYDIDTPITLSALEAGDCAYLTPALVPGYDLYFSFSGGPALEELSARWGAPAAVPLYCSADPATYHPEPEVSPRWDLGYLGTYSADRQPTLDALLCEQARRWPEGRFVVAGPQYPQDIAWPANVERIDHLPPAEHRRFFAEQRFTLNVTRADMIRRGFSPSVRLFEAACCGTPIVSDWWPGLDTLLEPGHEILIAHGGADMHEILREMPEGRRRAIGAAARARVLQSHTADHRAAELEAHVLARLATARRGDAA